MSRLRHERKHRMAGGMTSEPKWNAGGSQNAAKEAEELKHGGRAKKHHGEGDGSKKRHDRPKRAKGGVVSHADHHPYGKHHDGGVSHSGVHVDGTGGAVRHKRAHGGALNKPVHEGHPHHNLHPHKRAHGGKVHDGIEHPDGDVRHGHHRAHRARGGRLRGEGMGAERTPLSGAAKIKEIVPGETAPHGVRSD